MGETEALGKKWSEKEESRKERFKEVVRSLDEWVTKHADALKGIKAVEAVREFRESG